MIEKDSSILPQAVAMWKSVSIVLILFVAFTPTVYAMTSQFYSYSCRSNYTVKEELIDDTDLSMPEPTDELEFDLDPPAEEIELWQPEEVDIKDMDSISIIEAEGLESLDGLEEQEKPEEPEEIGSDPTGEE